MGLRPPLGHSPTSDSQCPHLYNSWVTTLASLHQYSKNQMTQYSHKWQLAVYTVLQHITSEFSNLSKELLLIFLRSFSIYMKMGGLRGQAGGGGVTVLLTISTRISKWWFCVYPSNRTGREEIRSNQVKRKSNTTGNDLHKRDLDKARETSNWQPSEFLGFSNFYQVRACLLKKKKEKRSADRTATSSSTPANRQLCH